MAYDVPAGQAEKFEQHIGIALEEVFGEAADAPTAYFAADSTLDWNPDFRDADRRMGSWDRLQRRGGKPRAEGTLKLEIGPTNCGLFASMATRFETRHMLSFTVFEYLDPDVPIAYIYAGCCANKLTLDHEPGTDLIATIDVIGRSRADNTYTAPSPLEVPELPFDFSEFTLAGGGSYDLTSAQKVALEIDHQLRTDKYAADGTGLIRHMPTQGRNVDFNIDVDLETDDWETARLAGTNIGPVVAQWARAGVGFSITAAQMLVHAARPGDGKTPMTLRAYTVTPGTEVVTWAAVGGGT
jgi:hypothetical protein